ncbi:conserved hypothetical protein [Anaeromyxobacter sp. K]|uniref:hypothetical protein n=1 Tax=Anaeromyxobacter sp. (strain K) TaxID=447217 RepID=UPI00015F9F46|nr:hypothetical protein [Anaeromyxobacter sp. K]ACG71719.1 conserved hypothetical protein [Anaeromyxobacter sp. K]
MPTPAAEIVTRYAAGAATHPNGKPLAPDAAAAWAALARPDAGRLGAARVRDSARREWLLEAHRELERGRFVVLRPAHGDLEPFRASADGYRPEAYLPISEQDWLLLALLAAGRDGDAGRDDPELAGAAFPLVDRMVREAQHRQLMGEASDEDDEEAP